MLQFLCAVRPLSPRYTMLAARFTSAVCSTQASGNQAITQSVTQGRQLFTDCHRILSPVTERVLAQRTYGQKTPDYNKFYTKDNVPRNFVLVCYKDMFEFCRNVQICLISGLLFVIGLCAFHWYELKTHAFQKRRRQTPRKNIDLQGLPDNYVVLFGCYFVVQLIAVIYFSKRNLIRIYHDPKADQGLTIVWEWFRVRQVPFTLADVKPLYSIEDLAKPGIDLGGLLKGNISICGHKFYTAESDYLMPAYYNRFMGYSDDRQPDAFRDRDDAQGHLRQKRYEREEKSFFYDRLKAEKQRRIKQRTKKD